MNQHLLVSVIIPCYNLGQYLDEAVQSIFNQTYTNIELIIVDDGSTDFLTKERLNKYRNDNRVQVIFKNNGGVSSARNLGIKHAKGEYICCLDADDKYHPEFIQKSLDFLEQNPQCGFVTTWFEPFGLIEGADRIVQIKKSIPLMLVKNVPHTASMFTKRAYDAAGGYDETMKTGKEDWDLWLSIIQKGYDYNVIDEVLFFYRIRVGSLSKITREVDEELYRFLLNKHKDLFGKIDIAESLIAARRTIRDYDDMINSIRK